MNREPADLERGRVSELERGSVSEEVIDRDGLETPRRYEQPLEDDEDPVMPADDATLNTKI